MQARKLESELDVKVAAYGKLCSGYEYGYSKGESGMATDQASTDCALAIDYALAAPFRVPLQPACALDADELALDSAVFQRAEPQLAWSPRPTFPACRLAPPAHGVAERSWWPCPVWGRMAACALARAHQTEARIIL